METSGVDRLLPNANMNQPFIHMGKVEETVKYAELGYIEGQNVFYRRGEWTTEAIGGTGR